jgi:hypothetical protein
VKVSVKRANSWAFVFMSIIKCDPLCISRVDQNHIYLMYTVYGILSLSITKYTVTFGVYIRIYTVLANPMYFPVFNALQCTLVVYILPRRIPGRMAPTGLTLKDPTSCRWRIPRMPPMIFAGDSIYEVAPLLQAVSM